MKKNQLFNLDPTELIEDPSMNIIKTFTDFMRLHQEGAIDLTRLVLEHCKEKDITKDYVFDVFEEAMTFVKKQLSQSD